MDGEWSFVETLRHLIFATDCWLSRAIHLAPRPYHSWGLPWTGVDPEWERRLGLDTSANPGLFEVLPVRREHQTVVRETLGQLSDFELAERRMTRKRRAIRAVSILSSSVSMFS